MAPSIGNTRVDGRRRWQTVEGEVSVPAQYQSYTYQSSFAPKRWLHHKRFTDAIRILRLGERDTVLDYGCGDGRLHEIAAQSHPRGLLFGYEPAQELFEQAKARLDEKGVTVVQSLSELKGRKFDKVVCLEVCEHLPKKELHELLLNLKSLLKPGGDLVVSVPIESGLPALAKNTFRFTKHHLYPDLSLNSYIRTFLGMPVRRLPGSLSGLNYFFHHIGFDFREFERVLATQFKIKMRYCSPLDRLGSGLNNTIYYRCNALD
jgi:SAM-dependent methyltransferase